MKKYFLFLNLFLILFAGLPHTALAKKKYRYIKREHGVRFQGNLPMEIKQGFTMSAELQGAYTYNWNGMIEVGPYFDFSSDSFPSSLERYGAGLLVEYNIITNRGKRKLIPAVGIDLGVNGSKLGLDGALGAHGALKMFVATRTAFTVALGYKLLSPFNAFFQPQSFHHRVDFSMGFSYYFDFY